MLENCEPRQVFYYFEQITRIPHGSGNTAAISDYLADFARERSLRYRQDELGNIIIWKDASEGYEDEEPVILQGHMDMVAVKDADCPLDLERDGLQVQIDGDYIYARKTSLGGDDGIAVAYALAILDDAAISHPPLEVVITVEEETGMEGASFIDLSGCKAKRFINLDSEEEGEFIVSCAGGARIYGRLEPEWETLRASEEKELYRIMVSGLTGGHSGAEIHHGRANANLLLGEALKRISGQMEFDLWKLNGGTKDNAIPVEAEALVFVAKEQTGQFLEVIAEIDGDMRQRFQKTDAGLAVSSERLADGKEWAAYAARTGDTGQIRCFSPVQQKNVIDILSSCPNGVQAMCEDMPELVETSLNLGVLVTTGKQVVLEFSLRSSVGEAKEELVRRLCDILEKKGAVCERTGDYPAWEYRKDSPLRDKMVRIYEEMYGRKPKVVAMHAGLECGIMSRKIEGLDCVSMGPDMKDIHTTRERLSISSTKRVWEYLLRVLENRD